MQMDIEQWNKIESPEQTWSMIYEKGAKNIQWGKKDIFNKWWWENWTATYKRIKLDPLFTDP